MSEECHCVCRVGDQRLDSAEPRCDWCYGCCPNWLIENGGDPTPGPPVRPSHSRAGVSPTPVARPKFACWVRSWLTTCPSSGSKAATHPVDFGLGSQR